MYFNIFKSFLRFPEYLLQIPVEWSRRGIVYYPFFFHDLNIKFFSCGNEWSPNNFTNTIYYSAFKGEYPCLATSLRLLQGVFLLSVLFY